MWLKITENYSPNFNLPKRSKKKIKFIILHYTGMKKELLAIKKLSDFNSKVSAHYFVKKNGEILNLVPDLYEAWHAGKSCWKSFKSLNKYSIGIEIQNTGHDHYYENFSFKQVSSIKKLLKYLIKNYKVKKNNVLGHSDISPDRKKDPGEKFPWKFFAKNKFVLWHNLKEKKIKKLRLIKLNKKEELEFLKNINLIGYKNTNFNKQKNLKILTLAFQRRFRQKVINGIPDKECSIISKNLLKR